MSARALVGAYGRAYWRVSRRAPGPLIYFVATVVAVGGVVTFGSRPALAQATEARGTPVTGRLPDWTRNWCWH